MANTVSHDQNFKNLILDYPGDALAFFAPEEAPLPDEAVRIIPIRQEQLQERLRNHFRALDTPLLVEWTDGRREAILFVLEEESDWRKFSLRRLAHYCLDLSELFETDRVVPVAIFLRDADAAPASLTLGTERRPYLTFDYLACKLREIPAERWQQSNNLVARVNLPNLRGAEDRKVEAYARAVRGLFDLEPDGGRREKYLEFIDIYAGLTENDRRRYRRQYPEDSNTMAGIIQRARDEGMEQGMQQGRVEGERAVLEKQLQRRFGLVPSGVTEKLRRASADDIETWAENVLDAETLDDVFDSGS